MEEPGRLQSMGSQRVRHNWVNPLTLIMPFSYHTTVEFHKSFTLVERRNSPGSFMAIPFPLCSFFSPPLFQVDLFRTEHLMPLPWSWGDHSLMPELISSAAQSCPTLYNPPDCRTPGLPVHHQLLEFTQTPVHWVGDAIQPSHSPSSSSPPAFNLPQHQGLFQ